MKTSIEVFAVRVSLVMLATIGLAGCGLFGGDEEVDEPAELLKFDQSLKFKKAWSKDLGDGAKRLRLSLGAASDGSYIYAASHDGKVGAYSVKDGKRRWVKKTKLLLSAGPGIADNSVAGPVIAFGSSDGDVIVLDAEDGRMVWKVSVSSEVLAPPAVTRNLVLVRTVDGKLVALRLLDGSEAWFVQQSVPRLSVRGTGAPVVSGNSVICGFDNGRIAAYDISDGSQLWDFLLSPPSGRTEVDRLSDVNATVRVVGSDVYVVSYQGTLASIAAESGQILWTREVSSHSGVGVDLSSLYVSRDDSHLVAMTRREGREVWRQDALAFRDTSGPTPFGSSVVVGDFDGYLHWFDAASGEPQARVRAGSDRIMSPPIVVNDTLFVVTDGGKIYAFRERKSRQKS